MDILLWERSVYIAGSYRQGLCDGQWQVFERDGAPSACKQVLTCDGFRLEIQIPGLDLMNWSLVAANVDRAQTLLPTISEGWDGPGRYRNGISALEIEDQNAAR